MLDQFPTHYPILIAYNSSLPAASVALRDCCVLLCFATLEAVYLMFAPPAMQASVYAAQIHLDGKGGLLGIFTLVARGSCYAYYCHILIVVLNIETS